MEYTITAVAHLSGVTQRTLRYYDEINLLRPGRKGAQDCRLYSQEDLARLQQILFYRELDFSLEHIRTLMNQKHQDRLAVLEKQSILLQEKRNRIDQILSTLEKTIAQEKGEITMSDQERFEGFKKHLIEENEKTYGKEVEERYGKDVAAQSNAKLLKMDEATYQEFIATGEQLQHVFSEALATGDPTSEKARELAELHKTWLLYTWPDYSKEAHANLVRMYTEDERFNAYYHGHAAFLRDAVLAYLHLA